MLTEFRNAVFIRHEVRHQGVSGTGVYKKETKASLSRALDYNSRTGEFEWKAGVDHEPTQEDLQLEAKKAELQKTLQYIERSGKFEGRNLEKPMVEGEVSGGGLWGADGLVDKDKFIDEVIDSKSNVVHSIFTVSRQWAEELHFTTKAEFQTFLRGHWSEFAETWGVIPKGYVSWCAEFHTDADMSVHCHITTFDRSGTFSGAKQIPHEVIETSKQEIRKAVFSEYQTEKNLVKDMMRNLYLNQIKLDVGLGVFNTTELSLERKALETNIDLHLVKPTADYTQRLETELTQIAKLLPEIGKGRLGAYSVSKEAREQAFSLVDELKQSNPIIKEAFTQYQAAVNTAANILGKTGTYRETYIEKQLHDLETRAANIVLRAAGSLNKPWERNEQIKESFTQIVTCVKQNMTYDLVREVSSEYELTKSVLQNKNVTQQVANFKSELVKWVEQKEGELNLEQEKRLISRVDSTLEEKIKNVAVYKINAVERYDIKVNGLKVIKQSVQDLIYSSSTPQISRELSTEFNKVYSELKEEYTAHKKISTNNLNKAANIIIRVPEVQANIVKAVNKELSTTKKDISRVQREVSLERIEQAKVIIDNSLKSRLFQEENMTNTKINTLVMFVSTLLNNQATHNHSKAHEAAHARITSKENGLTNDRKIGN